MVTPDNKINPIIRDSNSVNKDDEGSRIKRKPPSGDFRKVADEVEEKPSGEEEDLLGNLTKTKKKTATPGRLVNAEKGEEDAPLMSPFQLARGFRDAADEKAKESADDLLLGAADATSKKKLTPVIPTHTSHIPHQTTHPVTHHAKTKDATLKTNTSFEENNASSRYGAIEQPDLAAAAPFRLNPIESVEPLNIPLKAVSTLPSLQEVVDQIVEKVYTLKQAGDTQTVVDLGGNFKGSRLTVTESESAHGQLNITIDNLTGPNQALIESNRNRLINDLLESGVQVQRFVASPAIESVRIDVATEEKEQQRQGFQQGGGNNPRDGRRQKSDDENT
jgi:hypothetical protein